MFGIATVKQKSEPDIYTTELVLTKPINDYQLEDGTKVLLDIPSGSNLSAGCSIQVVKIMQYRNVGFPANNNAIIKPPAFIEANGFGGILALKVADNIYQSADGQGFDVMAKGLTVNNKFQADCYNVKKRCMQMGDGVGNTPGGGIAMIQARNYVNQAPTGSKFKISAAAAQAPRFTKIYSGLNHACGLNAIGDVFCWGKNDYGQLGNGISSAGITHYPQRINLSGVSKLALGANHTCALLTDGKLTCWGLNDNGQIGNGTLVNVLSPNPATPILSSVTDVTAGISHTCAIEVTGAVKCWGKGANYQLGNGLATSQLTPYMTTITSNAEKIVAGAFSNTTCAKMTDGLLKCWGNNTNGIFGNGTVANSSAPIDALGSAYARGGHNMVTIRNLLSPVNAAIELNAKDSSNLTNTLNDGPVHMRYCSRDLGVVVNAVFNNPPVMYQSVVANSCF